MVIVVMDCGRNMNREWKVSKDPDLARWDKIFGKMELLLHLMSSIREMTNNKSYFDENCGKDIEWVSEKIEDWKKWSEILTKSDMRKANQMWKLYNGPHNVMVNNE